MKTEDRTGRLIQAYDKNAEEVGLFRITGNNCPIDHFEQVIREYFESLEQTDEENANLGLFRWGIERIFIYYSVDI